MRRIAVLIVAAAALATAPAPALSQAQGTEAATPAAPGYPAAAQGTDPSAAPAAQPAPSFAAAAQQPRTMQAYWHVFIAFAVTLLLLFGYAISLGRRWAELERQVLMQGGAPRP